MTVLYQRRVPPRRHEKPDEREILAEGFKKRCPQCRVVWPASKMTEEDGIERCPNCVDVITSAVRAAADEDFAAKVERYQSEPQISQAPLSIPIPPVVTEITDGGGVIVSGARPLRLRRTVPAALLLIGRNFVASDTISFPVGISSDSPLVRTPTLVTLSVVADVSMAPGDHYSLIFNGHIFRDVFSVR
jgi:hypothetical protein